MGHWFYSRLNIKSKESRGIIQWDIDFNNERMINYHKGWGILQWEDDFYSKLNDSNNKIQRKVRNSPMGR